MSWSLDWTSRALRDLRKLDGPLRSRILAALDRYAQTGVGDVVQLTAVQPPEYRLRVGAWRIRFQRDSTRPALIILRILPRDKAY